MYSLISEPVIPLHATEHFGHIRIAGNTMVCSGILILFLGPYLSPLLSQVNSNAGIMQKHLGMCARKMGFTTKLVSF